MESKIIIIFLFIITFSSCKAQESKVIEQDNNSIYSKQEIVNDRKNSKKYALCSCLLVNGYSYADKSKKDNSSYTYIANGLKHPQFYSELLNFTKQKITKINYKSFEGAKVVLKMSECIDFYESKELEEYIMSIENKNYND